MNYQETQIITNVVNPQYQKYHSALNRESLRRQEKIVFHINIKDLQHRRANDALDAY